MNTYDEKLVILVLGGLIGVVAATGGLLLAATALAGLVTCGAAPADVALLDGFRVVFGQHTSVAATTVGCTPSHTAAVTCALILTGLLVALIVTGIVAWRTWVDSDTYFIYDLKRRDGFAQRREVTKQLGPKTTARRATVLRPGLPHRARPRDAGWKVGSSRGVDTYVSIEDSTIVIGPPRSGKGYRFIINAILDWDGPLITTSTRNDNLTATVTHRRRKGDVTVFDPQKLSGVESTLKVSPIVGCEDPMVAEQRAAALVSGSGLGKSDSNQEWASAAEAILAQLLHAAAIGGRTVADLALWGENPILAEDAADILNVDGPTGWSTALTATIRGDEKMLMNQWFGVKGALRPLRIPQIQEMMTPTPDSPLFDPAEFLAGTNTLYLIGTGRGAGAIGGFLGALMDDVVEVARRKALASAGSRLNPPLGLVLDEIANMFSWRALPTIMADGGGIGISPLVVLQARSQAETSWSRAEMQSVFSAATAKLMLGGSADVGFLKDMQDLLGYRRVQRASKTYAESGTSQSIQQEQQYLITMDEIRRMPSQLGMLAYRNLRPILLDLEAWTDRADARTIKKGKAQAEHDQQAVFATQNAPTPPMVVEGRDDA